MKTQSTYVTSFIVALVAGLLLGSLALAAAGVVSGTIKSVQGSGKSVVIELKSGKTQSFQLDENVGVKVDGKPAERANLAEGMRITVFTDSTNKPTKVTATAAVATPAKPADMPADEAPVATASKAKARGKVKVARGTGLDWPQFLGPDRNNISLETGLLRKWPADGPKLLWTATGLGEGYSTVAVADGMIFGMGNRDGKQMIVALSLEGGKPAWEAENGRAYQDGTGNGPRGTPAVANGLVFGLGAQGDLTCCSAKSGEVVWSKNILSEFSGSNIGWGISESVLVDGDRIICTPGGGDATVVALDSSNGNVVWTAKADGDKAGYASAIPIEVGGVKQYVQFTSGGTIGIRAEDGKVMWRNNSSANGTANCSAPLFEDNMVFSASGYGTGGAMLKLMSSRGETNANFGYHTKSMKSHHGGMVLLDGFVYGSDEGVFTCLELKTGKTAWQSRNPGKGSVTCADRMLIARNEGGPVTLIEATPLAYKELGKFNQPARSGRPAWAYPVVAQGKLFLRDQDILQCYELRK